MDLIREAIELSKGGERYEELVEILTYFEDLRIQLIKNEMSRSLGRPGKPIYEERTVKVASMANDIIEEYVSKRPIPEKFPSIEKWLRLTVLQDIELEFKAQNS